MASPDINTEDFQAAVDYLSCRDDVDPEHIGIIGICGWGGMALNAAALGHARESDCGVDDVRHDAREREGLF